MTVANVSVEFDGEYETFFGGQSIAGVVEIEIAEEVNCRDLTVNLCWATKGEGQKNTHPSQSITLYSGPWDRETDYEYQFELELPPGPYSYDGELFEVFWYVEAEVDVYGTPTQYEARTFTLEPGGSEDYSKGLTERQINQYQPRAVPEHEEDEDVLGVEGKVAVPLFVGGILVLIFVFGRVIVFLQNGGYAPGQLGPSVACFAFGILLTGTGGATLYSIIETWLRKREKIRRTQLHLESAEIYPGDDVHGKLRVEPASEAMIEEIQCIFKGYERVVSPPETGGKAKTHQNRPTRENVIHREVVIPAHSREFYLRPRRPVIFEFGFQIPGTAPYTFYAEDNQIIWEVEIEVILEEGPVHTDSNSFTVRPRPAIMKQD